MGCEPLDSLLRKLLRQLSTAAWVVLASSTAAAAIPGDVNGDETINVADVQCMVFVALDMSPEDPATDPDCMASEELADVNCDDITNVADIQLVVMMALSYPQGGLPAELDADGDNVHNACESSEPPSSGNVSCESCSLRLTEVSQQAEGGHIKQLVVGVDYAPAQDEPRPRLADIRLVVSPGTLPLATVAEGAAVLEAHKQLYVDPDTGNKWRKREDGAFQFFILGLDNTLRMGGGRLLTVTFVGDVAGSVSVALQRRSETFAPMEADAAISATAYDTALVVSP